MRSMRWARQRREDENTAPDYFLVRTARCSWAVSTTMAASVEQDLDRWPRPRWIVFVDLAGSRIRVRTDQVECLVQCTAEQRAYDRALRRALESEEDDASAWGGG